MEWVVQKLGNGKVAREIIAQAKLNFFDGSGGVDNHFLVF